MGILRFPWKSAHEPAEPVIGILAFEIAGLMSKVVNLWHSLSDKEVMWLREQVADSVGVRRFVSEDDNYLMELALEEIIENFGCISRSVARLSKRCKDPVYHRLEEFYKDPACNDLQWFGWTYRLTKMDRKVKKMERFVAATIQLSHEEEVLMELEQTLRRMQANARLDRVKLLEFQQKVMWQRQEVKNLRAMSSWGRTYDYIVRLMARSLFTILERIKLVFGVNQVTSEEGNNHNERRNSDFFPQTHSFPAGITTSVYSSESKANPSRFSSDPLRSITKLGINPNENTMGDKKQGDQTSKPEKFRHSKSKRHGGSFSDCMVSGSPSPIVKSCKPTVGGSMRLFPSYTKNKENSKKSSKDFLSSSNNIYLKLAQFNSKSKLLNVQSSTLGDAGLALQYANVIILIEKLSSAPHLISPDARDDLYNMLTTTIRTALRAKLKSYAKNMGLHVYNPVLAAEWNMALVQILDMIAPLAHNTIRWHSERNIEKQNDFARTNVLLVHTLYHANQAKAEAAITELLLGLNYVCRIAGANGAMMIREQASS